jgi:predicted adenylyl cyclase CyaB
MNIEAEVRSFINETKYNELLDYFKTNAKLSKEDYQESFYFDCEEDLRIQKNDFFAKVWLKKGNLHDDHREEIEVKFDKEDFEKLENLFITLGYQVEIKWFRKRFEFDWKGITVCLDYSKGYGYIIELEKMCNEADKESVVVKLKEKLQALNIEISSKEEFTEAFENYKKNWKELTS